MHEVSGIILAGGRGRRMGHVDKGWIELAGRPLVQHVLDRLAPQVDDIVISANRSLERYRALGHPVVPDVYPGFAGPLAGLHAALPYARHELAATVACDCPWLPLDLVARLHAAIRAKDADVAVALAAGRVHPVFCLLRRRLWEDLDGYLNSGERKVEAWYRRLKFVEVGFEDQVAGFRNINAPGDLTD